MIHYSWILIISYLITMAAQLLVHINDFAQLLHKDELLINSEWSIYSSVLPSVYVVYPSAPAIYFNPSVTVLTVCASAPRAFCLPVSSCPRGRAIHTTVSLLVVEYLYIFTSSWKDTS